MSITPWSPKFSSKLQELLGASADLVRSTAEVGLELFRSEEPLVSKRMQQILNDPEERQKLHDALSSGELRSEPIETKYGKVYVK